MAIPMELVEFAIAAAGVGVFSYLGAKYGAGLYAKLAGVASDIEGMVSEVEGGYPDEKEAPIMVHGKQFLADAKDALADGKVSFFEMRRQIADGKLVYADLCDMYAQLKSMA